MQPVGHLFAEFDVQILALVARIVRQNGDLANPVIHNLGELLLENLHGLVVVRRRDRVAHERVQCEDEAALGLVARLGKGLDLVAQDVYKRQAHQWCSKAWRT